MPMLDMPMHDLLKYQGRNPRPDDFDAFWDASLAEQRRTEPRAELVPADFRAAGVECFDLWFDGVGGARIHAKYLRPAKSVGKRPALLLFHGYSGSSGDWHDKLAWVCQGYCVAALDCRGQGGLSEDRGGVRGTTLNGHIIRGLDDASPAKLLFRDIFLDTAQLARVVMALPEVDAARIAAAGGSQGGALTLACAALEPRIARAAALYPFLADYQRVWEMDLAKDAYGELKTWFRQYDPLHAREKEVFTRLGYIDVQHLAPRIRARVLMPVGLMDAITPPSTQFAAYNKITAPKELLVYPDFGHEGLPRVWDRVSDFLAPLIAAP
ncbi:MAG TPA: alpha/beta fold hydrolase [Planctomycetota bacterium]|nr:alpha/beta fold hydrolase [Planctomycetota bacterium]